VFAITVNGKEQDHPLIPIMPAGSVNRISVVLGNRQT
jgi:hypothetical protein